MGSGEGGLLHLELKFLGLLQNSETWPKEDGGEAIPSRHDLCMREHTVVPAALRNQHWAMGQSKKLQEEMAFDQHPKDE